MIRPLLRSFTALAAAATLLAVVPAASAQTNNRHKLTRLGAVPASAMHVPPLTNAASLKRLMANKKMAADFRKGFEQAGLGSLADSAIGTLTSPMQVTKGGECSDATGPVAAGRRPRRVHRLSGGGHRVDDVSQGHRLESGRSRCSRASSGPARSRSPRSASASSARKARRRARISSCCRRPAATCRCCGWPRRPSRRKAHSLTPSVKSTCDCTNGKLTATVSVDGRHRQPAPRARAGGWQRRRRADGAVVVDDRRSAGHLHVPGGGRRRRSVHVHARARSAWMRARRPSKVAQTCSVKLTHVEGKKGYDFLIDASGTTSGSPNVPATTVVQLYGPTGAAIGQPITLTGDMKTTVTVPFKKAEGSYRVTSTVSSPDTVADCKHYGGKDNCEATDTVVAVPSTSSIFIDGLFGKERRQRPASEYDLTACRRADRGATRCSASARRCSGSRSATPSGSRTTGRPPATVAWRSTCRPASLATASTRSTRRRCSPISRRTST